MTLFSKQAENSPPGKIVRKTSKAATGGAALFIAFLALMLFRHGTGDPQSGSNSKESAKSQLASAKTPDAVTAPNKSPGKTDSTSKSQTVSSDEQQALAGNVLTILIDERNFLLQLASNDQPVYRPIPIERLLQIAPLATGDENGIRVRILRRENARASAEEQLKLDLARIGITNANIYMSDQFIP